MSILRFVYKLDNTISFHLELLARHPPSIHSIIVSLQPPIPISLLTGDTTMTSSAYGDPNSPNTEPPNNRTHNRTGCGTSSAVVDALGHTSAGIDAVCDGGRGAGPVVGATTATSASATSAPAAPAASLGYGWGE